MSVYKQVRKRWLKQLTKNQKKQLKRYIQDIADVMLEGYAETIRCGWPAFGSQSHYLPIDETKKAMQIYIEMIKD